MDDHVQPVSTLRNALTVLFIVVTNSFGNLLLAIGAGKLPEMRFSDVPEFLHKLITNPEAMGGTALLAVWMVAQLAMLSWSDLSYLVPVTASGYTLTAVLGIIFLGETIPFTHWIGILLISLGVLFVAETAPRTVHRPGGRAE